jgi:hypothetical protein
MENEFFCAKKMKTSYTKIVFHSKSNIFKQYRIIWANYVMIVIMTTVI